MPSTIFQFMFLPFLAIWTMPSMALAQIIPDDTLPNNSIVNIRGEIQQITGGTTTGTNLFHSFKEFSVMTGSTALFNNATTIENIITRVTGGQISNIDGMIKANGTANLFLLNPSGIIFGRNAQLNIGGSFLSSTADSLLFQDGSVYSATKPEITPLLTVSVPIGLQFGNAPGAIINRSQATQVDDEGVETVVGLQIQPGRTLSLVGGEVRIEGGQVSSAAGTIDLSEVGATLVGSDNLELNAQTSGGRIEIGAVGANNQVQIIQSPENPQILNLSYEEVDSFQDIQLSNLAVIDASGDGGGEIQVQGRRVIMNEGSLIRANTLGENPGGPLVIRATESLEVLGNTLTDDLTDTRFEAAGLIVPRVTSISASSFSSGRAGDIIIETEKVIVDLGAKIEAFSFGSGPGGDLLIKASESVEVFGQAISLDFKPELFLPFGFDVPGFDEASFRTYAITSGISASSVGEGDSGNVRIETGKLSIFDSGKVTTDPLFSGNGGTLTVVASDSIEVSGTSELEIPNILGISPSLLSAAATGSGNAKDVNLSTRKLIVRDGGTVQVGTFGAGDGGNLLINASESVEVSGSRSSSTNEILPSTLRASSFGSGNAGNLIINTDQLVVRDEADVAVNSTDVVNAGDIFITANSLFLDRGFITATSSSGEGGNLTLEIPGQVNLINSSEISTRAGIEGGGGNGGNLTINSSFILAFPDEINQITANAFEGEGGNIEITTNAIFGDEFLIIDASSLFGLAGTVAINNPDVDPTSGLVKLPDQTTDESEKVVANCLAASGNSFTITGRGGLPEDPTATIRGQTVLSDLRDFTGSHSRADLPPVKKQARQELPKAIVQVKGWIVNQDGEIELVAALPQESSFLKHPNCLQTPDS